MKIGLLGCKGTTLDLLQGLKAHGRKIDQVMTLSQPLAVKNQVAYYQGPALHGYCQQNGIPIHTVASYDLKNPADTEFFQSAKIDLLLVIGWERLVPVPVLETLGKYAVGMHGSSYGLPRGRGRSPMNWSILLGERRFSTSLFRYSMGVDDGDVIGTKTFDILDTDAIADLHLKNRIAMQQLLLTYLPLIEKDQVVFQKQPPEPPSFYPKRRPEDGGIDWNATTEDIGRLVRAVAPPYPGAFCLLGEKKITIERVQPFDMQMFPSHIKPGTIVDISSSSDTWVVKTKNGSVLVTDFSGVALSELKVGMVLESVDQAEIHKNILSRYGEIPPDQWEVR